MAAPGLLFKMHGHITFSCAPQDLIYTEQRLTVITCIHFKTVFLLISTG